MAEVRQHRVIPSEDWTRFIKLMRLPDLVPTVASGKRHRTAFFDELYLADHRRRTPTRQAARAHTRSLHP